MARVRASGRADGRPDGAVRRLTAPISGELFRRVGAYSKWSNRTLGEILETALLNYLKARDFKLGERPDDAESGEAA